MRIHQMKGRATDGTAVFGSMWPRGEVAADSGFVLRSAGDGDTSSDIPVQSRITAYGPDGSVKWAAHTADAGALGSEAVIEPAPVQDSGDGDIRVTGDGDRYLIDAGRTSLTVYRRGRRLLSDLCHDGRVVAKSAELCTILERRVADESDGALGSLRLPGQVRRYPYVGELRDVTVKEKGPIRLVLRIEGTHVRDVADGGKDDIPETFLPFVLYMEIDKDNPELRFTYTFMYDGDERRDFLAGCGIRFHAPAHGEQYNRHVRFLTDHGSLHEAGAMLLCWHPRLSHDIYEAQMAGEILRPEAETEAVLRDAASRMPVWSEYLYEQDSDSHYSISKCTAKREVCRIQSLSGHRAPGAAAFGDETGGLYLAVWDFWQKYPTAIRLAGLDADEMSAEVWFWPPWAEAMDFRHYDDTAYSQTYYEGFDVFGASAVGIANTSEFVLGGYADSERMLSEEALKCACLRAQKRALYVADPEYYHELHAFGRWSLPERNTESERYLEDQLDAAVDFYKKEVDVRGWYGMYDYGDVMHTYDRDRHMWRYDMGGYAWANTELVPTYWLWFQFLRTGDPELFDMAEAMTRHCSEVDVYHFGRYRGLGSRHNVRHWGCPCKEPRIAMAGHDRMYYYLTGDYRLEDVFADVLDADMSTIETDPMRFFFDKKDMVYPTHARTGPDWSSYCSNWMTQWERRLDTRYREKLLTGIEDIKKTPLKLISGTDFEYDPESGHMRYIGERATGGSHLSICQGSEQTWIELTELLDDPEWTRMVADYGVFYPKSNEEQNRLTDGLIGKREFAFPFMAAGIIAFGAEYYDDEALGKRVWEILWGPTERSAGGDRFVTKPVENAGNRELLQELPDISTNDTAQWCLNTIVALEFARKWLP